MIEIKHRFTGAVLFRSDTAESVRAALLEALKADPRADLAGADLAGADLAGAYLAGADLAGADLAGAYLADARNVPTDLSARSEPVEPYERKVRTDAERAADFRARHPEVPVVENLDAQILARITTDGCELDMSDWHSCETTHCRGGWAIHLAGKPGYDLERKVGVIHAARMIYRASTGRVPHFYASTEQALADIKRCAAPSAAPEGGQ